MRLLTSFLTLALLACSGEKEAEKPATPAPPATPPPPAAPPAPVQQVPGQGGPTLFMTSAQFAKGPDGKPKPGYALMTLWQKSPDGWKSYKVEDPDSNVFHKAILHNGSLYTVGAEKAWLKRWTLKDGKWSVEGLWNPSWGGKFNRLRDLEIGDVNGDGKEEFVVASHDFGVVGVVSIKDDGKVDVVELDKAPDTFVHEIEIGDIDGDGKNEFFATPSGRNQASGESQPGKVTMYKWDGTTYVSSVLADLGGSHAKEITAVDLTGKGKYSLFVVIEAETEVKDGKATVVHPVEIRRYFQNKKGQIEHEVIATIDDKQCRFLIPGDFDKDGKIDLVAAALKTGLFFLKLGDDGKWTSTNFDNASSGFEHTTFPADMDKDGNLELYVAADDQKEFRVYTYNAEKKTFEKALIGAIPSDSITWNLTEGDL